MAYQLKNETEVNQKLNSGTCSTRERRDHKSESEYLRVNQLQAP